MKKTFIFVSFVMFLSLAFFTQESSAVGGSYSSKASGLWSSPSTWQNDANPGVDALPPGDGDTWTIKTNHTVTLDDSRTTGNASLTVGGTIQSGGILTILNGGSLTHKNHMSLVGRLNVDGGGTYKFGTLGTSNNYRIQAATGAVMNFSGTALNHAVVTSDTTGGGIGRGGIALIQYATNHSFTSVYADFSFLQTVDLNPNTVSFNMDHSTVDSYGVFRINSLSGSANLNLTNNDFTNPLDSTYAIYLTTSPPTTGVRVVTNNWFGPEKLFRMSDKSGWIFENNVLGGIYFYPNNTNPYASYKNNLSYIRANNQPIKVTVNDLIDRHYGFIDLQTGGTDRFIIEAPTSGGGELTINRAVFDTTMLSADTDVFNSGSPGTGSNRIYTMQNSVVLPNSGGFTSGTLTTAHGNSIMKYRIRHNTTPTAGTGVNSIGAIGFGSGYYGHPGFYDELRDNLAWNNTMPSTYGVWLWNAGVSASSPGASLSGVAEAGTNQTTLVDVFSPGFATLPRFTPSEAGLTAYYTNGNAAGQSQTVTATNSSSNLTTNPFSGTPAAGDTYRLGVVDSVRPAGNLKNAFWNVRFGTSYGIGGINPILSVFHKLWATDPNSLNANNINLTSSPNFVDSTRNMVTFASSSTGLDKNANPGGSYGSQGQGAWSPSHGNYNVGDVVSNSKTSFYGGANVLYRAIKNHDPALVANTEPGTGTSFRTYWEYASIYEIRQNRSLISTLLDWIFAGFSPQNNELLAASDNIAPTSGWIGAVPGLGTTSSTTLTVNKVVVNDDGGTAVVSDFPLFVDGLLVVSGVSNNISVGTHTVTETSNSNYTTTFGGDCDSSGQITLALNDNKVCTITNNDIPATTTTLTINKIVINDEGGSLTSSNFQLFVDGVSVSSGTPTTVSAGTHVVSETFNPSYASAFSGDCNTAGIVSVTAGTNMVCTITNNDIPSPYMCRP